MKIRKLERAENQKTKALYQEVFYEDSQSFADYYYEEKAKDNQIYVAEDGENVCAMLHLNPYTLMVNGSEKESNYIVAVATKEEYRRQGLMRKLLTKAMRDMYEENHTFTFLMPASERIYLPYDFRTVYEQNHRYYNEEDSYTEDVRPLKMEESEELTAAANRCLAANYQVYAKRSKEYYERLMKEYGSDGAALMLHRKDGRITELSVKLSNHNTFDSHKPKIMVRIIDVRRMLMSLSLKCLMAVSFHVTDPLIEENNRCIVMTGTEFSGVMLMDSKTENSEGTITIAALTSLLFGAKTVEEVCAEDGVEMSERMKGEMKKIIPLKNIYLNEIV